MKKLIIIVLVVMIAAWAFFVGYFAGESHVYSLDNEYYNRTEALLDSIYNWNEDFMNDYVQETDVYYEYELAKEAIQ